MFTRVLIIGAGPAGLSTAFHLQNTDYLLLEMGSSIEARDHNDPTDSIIGVGGAGLFSDGKFSFYPAGTAVWNLKTPELEQAYIALQSSMADYLQVPNFPEEIKSGYTRPDKWFLKKYPCMYLTLDQRRSYVNSLTSKIPASNLLLQHQLISWTKTPGGYVCKVKNLQNGTLLEITAQVLVVGTGRFGPLTLKVPKIYRRIEYGVRVQFTEKINDILMTADSKAVSVPDDVHAAPLLDPKYIRLTPWGEIRTFCWCKRGEVVLTNHLGIQTYSGRSDIAPTDYNNFGFNIRIKDASINGDTDMFEFLTSIEPFTVKTVSDVGERYGAILGPIIEAALNDYLEAFPGLKQAKDIKFVGPTVEGVGEYPDINNISLKLSEEEIYCIGDCSGIFRGIIPSMLSGFYVAELLNT